MPRQRSSPRYTSAYRDRNMSESIEAALASWMSFWLGQMSRR